MKRDWLVALLLTAALALAAVGAKNALDLSWRLQVDRIAWFAPLGLAAVLASDGLLHGLFCFVPGPPYRRRFRALAEFFSRQTWLAILAGSLLAGCGEELLFRGVFLEYLRSQTPAGTVGAVIISAALFGLCHLIPTRELWPFALWAVWEGVLLGGVYVIGDSLAASVLVHSLHDIIGFAIFRFERQRPA